MRLIYVHTVQKESAENVQVHEKYGDPRDGQILEKGQEAEEHVHGQQPQQHDEQRWPLGVQHVE